MSEALGIEAPNPASVTTLADLVRELRVLHIHCGRPSMRELASRADKCEPRSLPHSTAQDALSGKRGLPRLTVLMALLRALDVSDVEPWRDAWRRAELHRQGLLDRPNTSASRAVASAPTRAAGSTRIAVVNVQRGAALVQELPLEDVVEQLADMPASDAARRLDVIPVERTVEVLTDMDDKVGGEILAAMRPTAAAAALTAMAPSAAAELILRIRYDQRTQIFTCLPAEAAPAIFAEMPDWITVLGQSGVGPEKVVQFLARVPFDDAVEFLTKRSADAPQWLTVASPAFAGRVVAAVKPEQAAAWLDSISGPAFVEMVDHLHPSVFHPALPHLARVAIRVLQALGEERLVRLLARAPSEVAHDWLRHLGGRLTQESLVQIRQAAFRR
ncbi:magnesium transporter MgtE N-terminal domain-containing protein [Micromonospora sp. DT62]|uniref:magnesium transporter MgtE N-terminal domain-containing protein n=1 Tax=Micromonospora sp. DT62 TaxID=3416521 RepID=UPI003CF67D0F